jgi:PKD repeat protein
MFWSDINDFDTNQILNNIIYDNDRQGIYIGGSYNDAIISNGNTISGNTIYHNGLNTLGNGPDNSNYGIQLSYADSNTITNNDIYGHSWDVTGSGYWFGQAIYLNNAYLNTVTCNTLHNNNYGVVQYTDGPRIKVTNFVNGNKIYSNNQYGIRNIDAVLMDGTCNWWGANSGPGPVGPGTGDKVSTNVDYDPWIGVVADAGGPYSTVHTYMYNFDGSGSTQTSSCGTITYLWDFGDGTTSTELNPTHTYSYGTKTYTVTLTVTITTGCGFTYTATDMTTASTFGDPTHEPPTTILYYPTGGETVSGTVTVQWFVHDSQDEHWAELPIYLYYIDDSNNWQLITKVSKGPQEDHNFLGEIAWTTTSLPDGTYRLLLSAVDSDGNTGHDESGPILIRNHQESPTNNPPNTPNRPSGSSNGKAGVEYTYTSSTSDPEGDQIWLLFDWGDNTNSGWLGPYTTGETCQAKHTWAEKDYYNIKVKAKDIYGKESSWSDPLPITMPNIYNPMLQFLERLLERFPNAFPVLRQLLG